MFQGGRRLSSFFKKSPPFRRVYYYNVGGRWFWCRELTNFLEFFIFWLFHQIDALCYVQHDGEILEGLEVEAEAEGFVHPN